MAKRTGKSQGYTNPVADSPDAPRAIDRQLKKDEPDEDVQIRVRRLLNEAIDYYEEELEPDQVKATEYYKGEPFGDEKEGRSKVVNTVVRDAVLAAIPSLMRIVYEADNVAEYKPRGPEDEAAARQATDYIRYLITEDNPGFSIFWNVIMDGLVRRIGTVKWWWDETPVKTRSTYTGLTEAEVQMLTSDPDVEVESGVALPQADGSILFDMTIYRTTFRGVVVDTVPNEEWVFSPGARSLEDARLYAHVREVPQDDLRAMLVADGMDADEVEELIEKNKGKKSRIVSEDLSAARQFDGINRRETNPTANEVEDSVLYAEAYAKIAVEDDPNYDEDALPERRLFKCVGPEWEIVNNDGLGECVDDDLGFATWTPIPEPHTIVGLSFWDLLKDIQRIISQIERGTLDSLAQAITPVTEVVNGMVNMQDFINPEVAGIRRVRAIGQTQTVVHHFVGGDTLPMLSYYGQVIEDRTGKNKGAMGLDADALQSTTKVAAAAILSASQQRIEIIARVFAETLLKPMFKGLLKLVTKHQQQSRLVRLRNQYVEVDPRHWDSTMDVQVNVALGAGTPNDKIEMLAGLASKQQELMQTGSPLVSNIELRNTLATMTELSGQKNVERYWKKWGQEEEAAMQQAMAQQPPPPDPNMALVEVERMKAATEAALAEKKYQLEVWKAQREDDRERDKLSRDTVLKEREMELKYQAEIEDSQLKAQIAKDRADQEIEVKREAVREMAKPRRVQLERGA